ncbi:ATP-binding protein [Kitasatospora sp. NPDC051170]|uniref:ATP-binding protein n=1 Tax=Kitasatospora sp. NPDC051170 TaxID=3364056 RepID=UPI0037A57ADF
MSETPSTSTIWLPRSRRSPGEARSRLSSLLSSIPEGECYRDSGLLLVSELVTNAVLHGTPAGYLIYLSLDLTPDRLRIEVHDARSDREPESDPSAPGLDGEAGRGLHLVKSLSSAWGCRPRLPIGKIVWCEVTA